MLKLNKTLEKKLDCLCGVCDHDCMNKTCAFNVIMNSLHPEEAQRKMLLKWAEDVVKINTPKTEVKKTKNTRGTIKKKKGK